LLIAYQLLRSLSTFPHQTALARKKASVTRLLMASEHRNIVRRRASECVISANLAEAILAKWKKPGSGNEGNGSVQCSPMERHVSVRRARYGRITINTRGRFSHKSGNGLDTANKGEGMETRGLRQLWTWLESANADQTESPRARHRQTLSASIVLSLRPFRPNVIPKRFETRFDHWTLR
jgi:hypothetical protein